MFHIKSFLNLREMRISSTRSSWIFFDNVEVRPHILTPFIELSIAVVAVMRRSIASSHIACRDMTRPVAPIDPAMETSRRVR
jgi:hypothetical protein